VNYVIFLCKCVTLAGINGPNFIPINFIHNLKQAKMNPKKLLTIVAIASVVLIEGCKKDDYIEVIGVCPEVVLTSPVNAASGVPLNKIVNATFSKKMRAATITQTSYTLHQGGNPITGTVTYTDADSTAHFTPSSPLTANTSYTATVESSVKDKTGNAMEADYVWNFSTGIVPTVILTDPLNAATAVALNKVITVTFSQTMNNATVNATTFTLMNGATPVTGTVNPSGTTATFTPTANLLPNTLYTATITTGAMNTTGIPIASNYVWTFTTLLPIPAVSSTDPINTATGVPLNKVVTATFNMPMNGATITTSTFTLKIGATPVAGTVSYAASVASFTPTGGLLSGNTYTATITTGAMNPAGTPIASNYVWTFSTTASLGPLAPDLKTSARFGILAYSTVTNNAGPSVINNMDVGISPGLLSSVTGFPPATVVGGAIYGADSPAPAPAQLTQAKLDLTAAYLYAEGATAPAPVTIAGDQGGKTLAPGIYKSTSTLLIQSGNLTLDAQGDANAVWIFQIASDFTTVGGSPYPSPAGGNVILSGGAQAKNIYWQVGSSAVIGDYTAFNGNILALTSITMNTGAVANGRMLAQNGAVVMTSTNIINKP
jgi:hypothetical protein